jgi:hypothetical protein
MTLKITEQVLGELSPIKIKEPTDTSNILGSDLEQIIPNIYDKNNFSIDEFYIDEKYKAIRVSANDEYLLKHGFLTIFNPTNREIYIDAVLDIAMDGSLVGLSTLLSFPSEDKDKILVAGHSTPEIYYTKSRRESVKKEFMEYMDELTSERMSHLVDDVIEFNYGCRVHNEPEELNEPEDLQKQTTKNTHPAILLLNEVPKRKKSWRELNSLLIESLVYGESSPKKKEEPTDTSSILGSDLEKNTP